MTDGEILKLFIDNQSKSKISIAKELKISKQTLFSYFKSINLENETKKKFEDYFGEVIFTGKYYLQGGHRVATTIKHIEDKDIKIASLESEILKMKLEKIETNLNEILSNQKVMMVMLSVAMNNAIDFYAAGNKTKAADLKNKMRSEIAAATK